MLGRILKGVTGDVKENAYKNTVRPILENTASVWDLYVEDEVKELEKVQRRAARWVNNKWGRQGGEGKDERDFRPSIMLKELGWSSVRDRRKVERLVRMYKVVNGVGGGKLEKYFKGSYRGRGTSSRELPRVLRRTERGKQSMLVRTVREWNVLREELVTVIGVRQFQEGSRKGVGVSVFGGACHRARA